MSPRATPGSHDDSATVVISQKVRPGREDEYRRWQDRTNEVAGEFDGFEGTEQYPPPSAEGNEWVVVFRFSHLDQLTAWMGSDTRRELLEQGRDLFEEAPTQEVLAGGTPVRDAVTAVVSHDVRPDQERAFVSWQEKILSAQRKFPGFMGSELFRPVKGVQDKWVAAFRFDTRHHLDKWPESTTRRKLLDEGRGAFVSYDVRKVGSAFGSWFRFEQGTEEGAPPNWKQAMSVVLALYPTVEILNLVVSPRLAALGLPGYLALFISNVLSVCILTWLLMPLVNRALAFWLMPGQARSLRIDVAGAAVVAICWLAFVVIFGLTTGRQPAPGDAHDEEVVMSEHSWRSRIEGALLRRGDAGYETARARALWNELKPDRYPDVIVRATCERDVQEVLKLAVSRGLRLAVRAGGHSWCGSPLRDGGILLDLSGLNQWKIDADSATATVQPGVIGSRFARELARRDLAFPAGHCPSVALGGYLLSGGLGWNSGLWGVGCASVLEITAVTADGEVLRCTEEEHPGLFWAARGAGPGFFAVVTSFRLRLQPRPTALATTSYVFPLAAVGPVADWATETARELPANVELSFLLAGGDASGVTDGPWPKVVVVTATAFANSHTEAVGALHPLRSCPLSERPLSRRLDEPTSLAVLYDASMDLWPDKHRYAADTLWSHEDYAVLLAKLGDAVAKAPSGESFVLAPVSPVSQEDELLRNMAFSVLGESYVVPYAVWADPAQDDVNVHWLRDAMHVVEPFGTGHYIAEADLTADPSRARRSFTAADWDRLQSLRAEYDPQSLLFSYLSA